MNQLFHLIFSMSFWHGLVNKSSGNEVAFFIIYLKARIAAPMDHHESNGSNTLSMYDFSMLQVRK